MDIRKVKKLIELLEESNINELEITEGEDSVRISRGAQVVSYAAPPAIAASPVAAAPAIGGVHAVEPTAPVELQGHIVNSPMVGSFYASPAPGSPAFASVGQTVSPGDVLCIIEAMKIMNPIEAERAGTITAVLAENGHPVEYEQPLFVID